MDASPQTVLDRMVLAVEKVRERLLRAARALEDSHVPYAVIEDNAVAAWVAKVDLSAVRNTPDVDILLRREDFEAATRAMESAGFVHRHEAGSHIFLDGSSVKSRDSVRIGFALEKVRADVNDSEQIGQFRVLSLEPLARIKLTAFRARDQMHLRDLIDVGLIDATWPRRFPPELAARLQHLIDTPEG